MMLRGKYYDAFSRHRARSCSEHIIPHVRVIPCHGTLTSRDRSSKVIAKLLHPILV